MADLQTPNQEQVDVYEELVATGAVIPFERKQWRDFPLKTRLRVIQLLLDGITELSEQQSAQDQAIGAAV